MIATYLTILVIAADNAETVYGAIPYQTYDQCEFAMMINGDALTENGMMLQCVKTNMLTSTSTPIPRPDNLMEAYND